MSYEFYKMLHILGLLMIFSGLVGLWGTRVMPEVAVRKWDRPMALIHGFGMAFVLVGGFGMLARLGMVNGLPGWIYVKLLIWFVLGGSLVLAKRKAHLGLWLLSGWIILGSLSAYMAIYKPL